jgi:hypothetical protein
VTSLGGIEVDDWRKCTHLITDRVLRTVKFLCCLSDGKHIMSTEWLEQSSKKGYFIPEELYTLDDKSANEKYGLSLSNCIQKINTNSKKLFNGISFYATTGVKPDPEQLKEIIEAAGGKVN